MNIGTLSLNINTDDLNYGAVLHSWAFQRYLEKHFSDIKTEVIDYTTPHLQSANLKYPFLYYVKRTRWRAAVLSILRVHSHAVRYEKFKQFERSHLKVSLSHYSRDALERSSLNYDMIICESDVIWAPGFFGGKFDPAFFMALNSMCNIKKIVYAASVANGNFTQSQEEEFKMLTQGIEFISCRETYAAEYVQKLISRPVSHVLDPVLLLNMEDYCNITSPRLVKEPYLLLYLPLQYSIKIVVEAKKYARNHHLRIVEVSRYPWEKILHKTYLDAGIEEFLSLIKYADVIFSNSFHAVCFSLVFHKEFFAFSRKTGKKIEDICKLVNLDNRFIADTFKDQPKIDYDSVDRVLYTERRKSEKYLSDALAWQ